MAGRKPGSGAIAAARFARSGRGPGFVKACARGLARGLASAIAIAVTIAVAGCAAPAKPTQPGTAGQLLALSQCPLRIAAARAWVSHLPGQRQVATDLHVSADLLNHATAVILRSDASTPETLVLEMRISEDSTTPGRIVYREAAPKPLYRQVVFRCHGGDVHIIQPIETDE
jgi:hypothetical protein